MALHILRRQQILKIDINQAWQYFSDPRKLPEITPPDLAFKITSEVPDKIYQGLILTYSVQPILGIKTTWLTEITAVKENEFFIDEQRFGPYSFWHHKHYFKVVPEGTLVEDLVHYKLPMSIIGELAHKVLVKRRLNEIFDYRKLKLAEIFNS